MKKKAIVMTVFMLFILSVPGWIFATNNSTLRYQLPEEKLSWNYFDGVLTISGNGKMVDYSFDFTAPWHIHKADVKKINIEDGVTTIGILAFWDFVNLKEVNIPDSMQNIYGGAFKDCKSLKSVIIPNGTNVEETAFPDTTVTLDSSTSTYKVVFDANGGEALYGEFESVTAKIGDSVVVPIMPARKKGYMFLGWSIDPNADKATYKSSNHEVETLVSFNEDTTLYAVYKDLYLYNTKMTLKNRMFASSKTHGFVIKPDRMVESYLGTALCIFENCPFCNINNNPEFNDIISLQATNGANLYGLRSDGTVVVVGYNGPYFEAVFNSNACGQQNVDSWDNIVAISASNSHILGLRSDGTVLATGDNTYNQCNVEQWRDIVQVSAADNLSVGLKSDGTVVYLGKDYVVLSWKASTGPSKPYDVNENLFGGIGGISDIVKVQAISNDDSDSLGIFALKADGTLMFFGDSAFFNFNQIATPNTAWFVVGEDCAISVVADGKLEGTGNAKGRLSLRELNQNQYLQNLANFDVSSNTFCAVSADNQLLTSHVGSSTYMRSEEIYGSFNEIKSEKDYNQLFAFDKNDTGNVRFAKCIDNAVLYINSDGMLFSTLKDSVGLPKYIGTYSPNIIFDGVALFGDADPVITNERTMVPLRLIFEKLGATVDWNNETQTITAVKDSTRIVLSIDKNEMYKNDEKIDIDIAPTIINRKTFVPVRVIAESFDCNVDWDVETQSVIITSKSYTPLKGV